MEQEDESNVIVKSTPALDPDSGPNLVIKSMPDLDSKTSESQQEELSAATTNLSEGEETKLLETKLADNKNEDEEESKKSLSESFNRQRSQQATPPPAQPSNTTSNSIFFYGVTYLGCSSVNAPKSEAEINRIMSTLNEQAQVVIEVTMSMPQTIEDKIVLYDSNNSESKIAEYKMSHVLFVVRGGKTSPENSCFAFTTCHGDSMENLMFSCHVFRCNLVDAVSKIL
jgi:hypothetical protein